MRRTECIVHELFPDLPEVDAESSDALVPALRSPWPKEKHSSHSETAYRDLLSKAVEALRCLVANTTKKLHAEQGPDSSRAFLSSVTALSMLPTEDFARLCTGIYRASASYYPDTPPASDAGSPSADSSKEQRTTSPVKGIQIREEKLRNSSRIPEKLLSSLLTIIGNDSLVGCKSSKATLEVATSRCSEFTIITSSEGSDWKQSCIGCGGHCH
ncbi:uncharacterized protein BP5553_10226 [Venustampulla echinocandica]|uniref:Uncharacterized protein n=1 Tax=Venustampulla echinocandica TaxID=2656787 RepID=A0A370T9K4_9HELO|nr:uncharacterized protein BP5553_10226 [Venustampulla echinocandica]RDL30348.1 hypothetical protein BP5553_10226 [Venustampulla echinocandica]